MASSSSSSSTKPDAVRPHPQHSTSCMDLRIEHHWNDAIVVPHRPRSSNTHTSKHTPRSVSTPVPTSASTLASTPALGIASNQGRGQTQTQTQVQTQAQAQGPPEPQISRDDLKVRIEGVLARPTTLDEHQYSTLCTRLWRDLDLATLTQPQVDELWVCLGTDRAPAEMRKGLVEFIRTHQGVVRWASGLRRLAESVRPKER